MGWRKPTEKQSELFYQGGAVGVVHEGLLSEPTSLLSYRPYRSRSHLLLHQAIAEGRQPICTIFHEGKEYSLKVLKTSGYGQLDVSEVTGTASE